MTQPTSTPTTEVIPTELTEDERPVASFRLDRLATLNALVRTVTPTPRPAPKPVPVRVRHLD